MISSRQNQKENLDLLAAQRRLYSDTKRWRAVRTVGAMVSGIPLPVLAVLVPSSRIAVATVAAAWLVVSLVILFFVENGKKLEATRVMEEFDVSVFGLRWNFRIAGSKVPRETIAAACRRDTGSRAKLLDWYPVIVDELPEPLSVLVCQRAAAVWDWRLRRGFSFVVGGATMVLLLAAVAASIALHYSSALLFIVFIVPMMPAFVAGTNIALSHRGTAREQSEMQLWLDEDWEQALRDPTSLTMQECRQHQDCRYRFRRDAIPIPDTWYRLRRARYELDMTQAAAEMVAAYNRTRGQQ